MARISPQVTLTLSPDAFAALDARRVGVGDNRSNTVSALLTRYARICERCAPDLAENEWNLARDALNGCWLVEYPCSWARAELEDSVHLNKTDQKWSVDWPAMRAKLERLDEGGWTALVDAVERWWRQDEQADESKNGG